jgi:hypothetical protein
MSKKTVILGGVLNVMRFVAFRTQPQNIESVFIAKMMMPVNYSTASAFWTNGRPSHSASLHSAIKRTMSCDLFLGLLIFLAFDFILIATVPLSHLGSSFFKVAQVILQNPSLDVLCVVLVALTNSLSVLQVPFMGLLLSDLLVLVRHGSKK